MRSHVVLSKPNDGLLVKAKAKMTHADHAKRLSRRLFSLRSGYFLGRVSTFMGNRSLSEWNFRADLPRWCSFFIQLRRLWAPFFELFWSNVLAFLLHRWPFLLLRRADLLRFCTKYVRRWRYLLRKLHYLLSDLGYLLLERSFFLHQFPVRVASRLLYRGALQERGAVIANQADAYWPPSPSLWR